MADSTAPVLILGAGINGCSAARELVLNGIPVVIVDKNDIAFGATSKSSRLIHGGVRYLEYGEFRLVRESLHERERLLRLAPQFVERLNLHIPVSSRFGGLVYSALRFLSGTGIPGISWLASRSRHAERGVWLVRMGLWMYDRFTRYANLGRHTAVRLPDNTVPPVDRSRYRWVCSYADAHIRETERLVIAMLEDARRLAEEKDIRFDVYTWAAARLDGNIANVERKADSLTEPFAPSVVLNATGAWGDRTFADLQVSANRMFGGTRGSHIFTSHAALRDAVQSGGIYAEASDGRLVFILPFGDLTLVGTTDERFNEPPGEAVASEAELDYLVEMVNTVLPQTELQRSDVNLHYSGVRPLPYREAGSTAAISRDHSIQETTVGGLTFLTLVGGKLTTCRAFGELVADRVFTILGVIREASTQNLPYAGGEDFPDKEEFVIAAQREIAASTGFNTEQVAAVWKLCGTRTSEILKNCGNGDTTSLDGTDLPLAFVKYVIQNEWVRTVGDLVERRLLLIYRPGLTRACLTQLAECLVDAARLERDEVDSEVDRLAELLDRRYGLTLQA